MNADSLHDPSTTDAPTPPSDAQALTPSAGELLRGHREALGLKPEALAKALRVPLNKLQALEADRLDALPDAMFARALALAICRHLKVDAAPVLARLPQQDVSRLAARDERGLDFPLHRPSLLPSPGWLQLLELARSRWSLGLLLVAVALWFWTVRDSGTPSDDATVSVQPASVVTTPVVSPAVGEPAPVSPGVEGPATEALPAGTRHVVTPVHSSAVVLTPVAPTAANTPAPSVAPASSSK
jgi:cytoskeleton protein RodZ